VDFARAITVSLSSGEVRPAKNRNDILQIFVALQHALHTASNVVVLITDHFWCERL